MAGAGRATGTVRGDRLNGRHPARRGPPRGSLRPARSYVGGVWIAPARDLWVAVLDVLAPLCCPVCRGALERGAGCPACGLPGPGRVSRTLHEDRLGVYVVLAGGEMSGDLRRLIHAFKYQRDPAALALLAGQTGCAVAPGAPGWDALVPVPAHPVRRRERGHDAVDELARRLAPLLGLPVARLLRRARYCGPLTGHGRLERRRLIGVTLAARPAWGRLLLLDDVTTTGTTFQSCRRVLLAAGAVSVDLLAAARTPRPGTARARPAAGRAL